LAVAGVACLDDAVSADDHVQTFTHQQRGKPKRKVLDGVG
jgi:hypothetical protein